MISYCMSHPWGTLHSVVFMLSLHGCVFSSQPCWNQRGYTIVSRCSEGCLAHTGTSSVEVADGEHRAWFHLSPWMRVEIKRRTLGPSHSSKARVLDLSLLMVVEAVSPTRTASVLPTGPRAWRQGLRLKGGGGNGPSDFRY